MELKNLKMIFIKIKITFQNTFQFQLQILQNIIIFYKQYLRMLKNLLIVLVLLSVITAMKKHNPGTCVLRVRLRSSQGNYLHRNTEIPNGVDVEGTKTDAESIWGLEIVNATAVRFFNPANGLYLAACNGCRAGAPSTLPYSALAHGVIARDGEWVNWTWQKQADNAFVFMGHNRKALGPCARCATTTFKEVPFVHLIGNEKESHWVLEYVDGI